MLGFFKKKKDDLPKSTREKGEPVICALLLENESFPVENFLKQLAKARIAGKPVSNVERTEDDIVTFSAGDEMFALAPMPAPYPAADLEGPIATTWMWPPDPPIESVKEHRSHMLVTMMGGSADRVRRRLAFTAVAALAARQPGVMAIYWPEATLVHFPPVFIEMAATINTPEVPPLYVWVDLRAWRNEDGTTGLFTTGLSALGHMEIEIPSIDMNVGELREWLLNIIYYLLEKGPVLKHGETIGATAEQKIRIIHCASNYGHAGKVIRLEP